MSCCLKGDVSELEKVVWFQKLIWGTLRSVEYSPLIAMNCVFSNHLIFPATTKYNNNDKFPFAIIV